MRVSPAAPAAAAVTSTLGDDVEMQAIETQRKLCESLDGKGGWSSVPGWPQTFAKIGPLGKPIIITIYVDDMVMSGPGHFLEWPCIRRLIRTTEPKRIDRVLGVNFTFKKIKRKIINNDNYYYYQN